MVETITELDSGDDAVLVASFNVAGVLTDPTAVTARVRHEYDDIPTLYTFGVDSQVTKVSTGVFKLTFPVVRAGNYVGNLTGTGTAKGTVEGVFRVRASRVLAPASTEPPRFCLVQDVADVLHIDIGVDDARVLAAIRRATSAIQNYTHQTLELVADDVVTLDVGPGQNRLFLPQLPVVSVLSVVEDGETLVVGRTEDYLLGPSGILYRTAGRGRWVEGVQMVTVTYTHGYPLDYDLTGWPQDIRDICALSAARQYQAGLRAAEVNAVPGVAGTTIGDYSVTYSAESAGGAGGMLLGVTAAPLLLKSEREQLDEYKYKRLV